MSKPPLASISNPKVYSAEQYASDMAVLVPRAISDLHKCGLLITCGHCGSPHDGTSVAFHACTEHGTITAVEIIAVCDTCTSYPLLPPEEWTHVNEASGLFYEIEHWWATVQRFRFRQLLRSVQGPCAIIGGRDWE
jgi:hypothetical protein